MTPSRLGELFALLAALNWALALVLFKRSGERVSPLALNLFKNVVGIILLIITLAAMGQGFDVLRAHPVQEILILALSGVLGIAVADTIFFVGLNLCGVGITSIVDCTYSPFAILLSFVLLGEPLTVSHMLGTGLILSGVLLSTGHTPPTDRTPGQMLLGVFCGTLAIFLMVFSIIYAKPVLTVSRFPLVWATTIRLLAGTAVLAALTAASRHRATYWSCFKPAAIWKHSIPGSVLGAYLSMVFWLGGFQYAQASVAAVLNQTSAIFGLILATLLLKEPFTRRKLMAVILAFTGVIIVAIDPLPF